MTQTSDEARNPIIAAVQTALTDFGMQVKTELDVLRDAVAAERAARIAAESQVAELSTAQDALGVRLDDGDARMRRLDQRTIEGESTIGAVDERLEAVEAWSDASTDAANEIERRLSAAESQVNAAESQAATFADDIAVQLSQATTATDAATATLAGLVTGHAAVEQRLDDTESRFAGELEAATAALTATVDTKLAATDERRDERLAERLAATEKQIGDDVRARLAEVDGEFELMAAGVESSVTALNERANDIDTRLGDVIKRVTALEAIVAEIDVDVIDDLSERVSAAAGEAVLVRIETERFQESIKETNDKMMLRITEVETQLQAQEMDVESAVQLERLEEIERALIELDPAQFVRIDGSTAPYPAISDHAEVSSGGSGGENAHVVAGRADEDDVPPKPTLPSSSA